MEEKRDPVYAIHVGSKVKKSAMLAVEEVILCVAFCNVRQLPREEHKKAKADPIGYFHIDITEI
jgi:hypothetical protein